MRAAANPELSQLLGFEMEIDPVNALLWCIRLTAGEVKFWQLKIIELEESEWIEESIAGKQLHLYARSQHNAVERLARYSQMAMSAGVAERAIRLAEAYGEALSQLIDTILGGLGLTKEQRMIAPMIVRKALIAADHSQDQSMHQVIEGTARQVDE